MGRLRTVGGLGSADNRGNKYPGSREKGGSDAELPGVCVRFEAGKEAIAKDKAEEDRLQAWLKNAHGKEAADNKRNIDESVSANHAGTEKLISDLERLRTKNQQVASAKQAADDEEGARILLRANQVADEDDRASRFVASRNREQAATDQVAKTEQHLSEVLLAGANDAATAATDTATSVQRKGEAIVRSSLAAKAAIAEESAALQLEKAVASGNADAILAAMQRKTQAAQMTAASLGTMTHSIDAASSGSKRGAYAMLQFSYAAQDLSQSGFGAIVNNVPGMVNSLDMSTKAAGALMIGAVILDIAMRNSGPIIKEYAMQFGLIEDPAKKFIDTVELATDKVKRLSEKEHKITIDYDNLREANKELGIIEERLAALKATQKGTAEEEQAKQAANIVKVHGGSGDITKIIHDNMKAEEAMGNRQAGDELYKERNRLIGEQENAVMRSKTGDASAGNYLQPKIDAANAAIDEGIRKAADIEAGAFATGASEAVARMKTRVKERPELFKAVGTDETSLKDAINGMSGSSAEMATRMRDEKDRETVEKDDLAEIAQMKRDEDEDKKLKADAKKSIGDFIKENVLAAKRKIGNIADEEKRKKAQDTKRAHMEKLSREIQIPVDKLMTMTDGDLFRAQTAYAEAKAKDAADAGDADKELSDEDKAEKKREKAATAEQKKRDAAAKKLLPGFELQIQKAILRNEMLLESGDPRAQNPVALASDLKQRVGNDIARVGGDRSLGNEVAEQANKNLQSKLIQTSGKMVQTIGGMTETMSALIAQNNQVQKGLDMVARSDTNNKAMIRRGTGFHPGANKTPGK